MTLGEKQRLFAHYTGLLILHAYDMGYEITFGETYRSAETAAMYAQQGRGIRQSLHTQRLAIDLNLFRLGKYLTETEDHRPLGEWWEQVHELARWGGRFGDGNHYSFIHEGIK